MKVRTAKLKIKGGEEIAEIEKWEMKKEVMSEQRNLKRGIYIDNDLTKEERVVQSRLRERKNEERRSKKKHHKSRYRKIKIGNNWYFSDDRTKKIQFQEKTNKYTA